MVFEPILSLAVNNERRYYFGVIRTFHDKDTEKVARGDYSPRFPPEIRRRAKMHLDQVNMSKNSEPIHPGEHLAEFLSEFEISQYRLAKDILVPPRRINEIVQGKRSITADTALRLGRYFGTSAQFWMNLQGDYDLAVACERIDLGQITKRTAC